MRRSCKAGHKDVWIEGVWVQHAGARPPAPVLPGCACRPPRLASNPPTRVWPHVCLLVCASTATLTIEDDGVQIHAPGCQRPLDLKPKQHLVNPEVATEGQR
eukprot:365442-Chlamydomonas_euryale.AAC.3